MTAKTTDGKLMVTVTYESTLETHKAANKVRDEASKIPGVEFLGGGRMIGSAKRDMDFSAKTKAAAVGVGDVAKAQLPGAKIRIYPFKG